MSNLAIKTDYFNYLYNAKEDLKLKQEEEEKAAQEEAANQQGTDNANEN